jgi:hypothetical protein
MFRDALSARYVAYRLFLSDIKLSAVKSLHNHCLIASGGLELPMKKMVKSTLADNYSDLGVGDGRN